MSGNKMNDEIIKRFMEDPVNGRLVLSASLGSFIRFFHWYIYHQEFVLKSFHLEIIRKIEDIAFGRAKKRNLAITISPRLGKSSIAKYACAWSYMINPASNNIYTSYSDDLANDFSKDIREIVESEPFRVLTGLTFKKGKTGADYWVTSGGGGFRAAPLGGGLTGYGFGVSGEEFGGFGICFPYEECVWTDRGIISIGEIVEERLKVRVISYNFQNKTFQYQPIDGYVKNGESDVLKLVFEDGSVECTPDHYFWTERGYVKACDLTVNDRVMVASNSLHLANSNFKFIRYILARIIFIKDKIKLFLSESSDFYRSYDISGKTFKGGSSFDIRNSRRANSVISGNRFIRTGVFANIYNILRSQFRTRKNKCSMFNCISHIIRLSSVCNIFKYIIGFISIKVSNFYTFMLNTYKSMSNSLMNVNTFGIRVFGAYYKKITTTICAKFKHFFRDRIRSLFRMRCYPSSKGFNITSRTYCITSLKSDYRKPLFIYKVRHIKNSYCLAIRSNHNMVVGRSQGFLAKNCDDPNKPSLVKSQTELQNTIDLYENAFKSRANNRAKSPILLIMQRVAINDLVGYILENEAEDWDLVKIPALNEETGESIWEDKLPAKELWKMKKQSPFVYWSQYQQEPIVVGGSVIKTEWFRFYDPKEDYNYQYTFVTSDTAQKKGEANDFTVFSFWGKTYDNRLHLIDMVRGKFDAAELKEQVRLIWEKWRGFKVPPYAVYIEDKSSGIGVLQEMRQTYPIPLIPITRARYKNDNGVVIKADKLSRALTCVPYIANGWVYLPNSEKDDISSILLSECAAFNMELTQKHDDMCFVAGTKVATLFGDKNIEDVRIGEYVITPLGIRKVLGNGCTGMAYTIEKFNIEATPNHKFFTKNGYKRFDTLDNTSELDRLSLGGLIKWKYKSLLSSMASNTVLWEGRENIIYLSQLPIQGEKVLKDCTLRFGSFIRERKFLKGISFITKTTTLLITTSLIWSVYQGANILKSMKKTVTSGFKAKAVKHILNKLENLLKNGIKVQKDASGIVRMPKINLPNKDRRKNALIVEESLKLVENQKFVPDVIVLNGIEKKEQDLKPVYNLTISSDKVYYANSILVSNCDTMMDAIDIAFGNNGVSSIFI